MANTLPSLVLLSDLALPELKKKAPLIAAFATNLSSEVADKGTGIVTRYVNPVSASIWSGSFAPTDFTANSVTVTLGEPIFRSVGYSPNQIASYTPEFLTKTIVAPMVADVLAELENQIYSLFSAANFPITAYSASSAGFGFNAVQSGSKVLDISGSRSGNVALLNTEFDYALQGNLQNTYGVSAPIINGQWETGYPCGKVKVFPAYGLQKVDAGLAGVVCSPDAVAIATRIPSALDNVEQVIITDTDTGLSVALERWSDPTLGKLIYAVKCSVGVAKGRPGMVARLIDSANP